MSFRPVLWDLRTLIDLKEVRHGRITGTLTLRIQRALHEFSLGYLVLEWWLNMVHFPAYRRPIVDMAVQQGKAGTGLSFV